MGANSTLGNVDDGQNLNSGLGELRKSYSEKGYVIAPQVFSTGSLSMLCQSLQSVLDKPENGHADHACSLEDLILKREAQDHSLVYKAAQSVGSSVAT